MTQSIYICFVFTWGGETREESRQLHKWFAVRWRDDDR